MITQPVWAQGMTLLAERYNREMSAGLAAVYLEQLSPVLDDPGFIAAVKLAIRGDQFYPTIQRLIDLGESASATPLVDPKVEARRIFYAIAERPGYDAVRLVNRYDPAEIETQHGVIARLAFQATGGNARFIRMTVNEQPHAAREFVDAYVSYTQAEALGHTAAVLAQPRTSASRINRGPEPLGKLLSSGTGAQRTESHAP